MIKASAQPLSGAANADRTLAEQFDQIVLAYEKRVYNVAFRMLGDYDDAADVTQEAFIKAYRAYGRFRGDSSVYTWLYRIVTNCCKNRLKDRDRAGRYGIDSLETLRDDDTSEQMQIPDWRYAPEPALERQELREQVHEAIQSLPPDYRIVIILRDLQGLTYKEISSIVGVPLETVKTRIFRGRAALRGRLADYVTG
ncbi:MAG TPA: sigma-70 family RNA polymerase sigma factor [Armatimonadota bacterium]|nr:sigma-70 family RNA polymerase sigma factor [Armatimonadota bacterium]